MRECLICGKPLPTNNKQRMYCSSACKAKSYRLNFLKQYNICPASVRYHERKEKGLCPICGRKLNGDKWLCKSCLLKERQYRNKTTRQIKEEIIVAYGGKCTCCGEDRFEFLTIDHINGGGNKHRRSMSPSTRGGGGFYRWLKKQGFPKEEYQLLCMNCNFAKGHYGICPHKIETKQEEK